MKAHFSSTAGVLGGFGVVLVAAQGFVGDTLNFGEHSLSFGACHAAQKGSGG